MTKNTFKERVSQAQVVFDGMTRSDFDLLFAKAERTHKKVHIESDPYGHDGGANYYMAGEREETDAEYEARLAQEAETEARRAKLIAATEIKERRELARLKKKYEKKA